VDVTRCRAARPLHATTSRGHPNLPIVLDGTDEWQSTYLRQTALIKHHGRWGSFVPAKASLPIFERVVYTVSRTTIFGGTQHLLVEAEELAHIFGTARALFVLLDEVGRGTQHPRRLIIATAATEYPYDHQSSPCLLLPTTRS